MPSVPNRWELYPKAPDEHFADFPDVERLVLQILHNRGIFEKDQVYDFLQSPYPTLSEDTPQLRGIDTAVERILKAIEANEQIIIYGDYDADGVTSTALMVQALQSFGARVEPYIPDRFEEGYGLKSRGN